jgi:hypothetical protein
MNQALGREAPEQAHLCDRVVPLGAWPPSAADQNEALSALEQGEVVVLPSLRFELSHSEEALLGGAVSDGRSKNISFDPSSGRLRGAQGDGERLDLVRRMMERFSGWSAAVIGALLPAYAEALQLGKTSFRPCEVETRSTSPRKDDRRLHVDAFPAQPVQGRRILRLFANIDPERPRVWNVGEPFEPFATRFLPGAGRPVPGSGRLMDLLRLTRGRRTAYDHAMLRLHDLAKEDAVYQDAAIRRRVEFPAGSSWIVFTDATLHAALEGRHALEQTFFLPVEAMADQTMSPLRILERLRGRSLV